MKEHNIDNSFLYPRAYYALKLDQFDMDSHRHDRYEIMYSVHGECEVIIEGKPLKLPPHSFVFVAANVEHKLLVLEGSNSIILNLEFELGDCKDGVALNSLDTYQKAAMELLTSEKKHYFLRDSGKMEFALKDLISELEHSDVEDFYIKVLFQRMLIELVKSIHHAETSVGIIYIKKATRFIKQYYKDSIKVEDIARAADVNKSYLQALFKKHFHCGVITYLNNYRMERATFLLRNSSLKIIDIAFEVGYNSRQHFGYIFEKTYGLSPKNYQKLSGQFLGTETSVGQTHTNDEGGRERRLIPFIPQ